MQCTLGGGRRYCQKKISGKLSRVVVGGGLLPSFSHPFTREKGREGLHRQQRNLYYFVLKVAELEIRDQDGFSFIKCCYYVYP